jgi:hypothetical protein
VSRPLGTDDTSRPPVPAAEKPHAIGTLDDLCAAASIAHQGNFELRRRIASLEIECRQSAQLFDESVQLVTRDIPEATAEAHRLIRRWSEQALLDPEAAELTATELSAAVEACMPPVRALLDRQREITESLVSLLATAVD